MNTLQKLKSFIPTVKQRFWCWRIKRICQLTKRQATVQSRHLNNADCFYCVYIYIPELQENDITSLFSTDQTQLKNILSNRVLFLSMHQAFEYSRFMGDNAAIVKLYTPETSIMSHDQKLTLRRRGLKNTLINGFYLLQQQENTYIKNPYFDETWLSQISSLHHHPQVLAT